MAPFSVAHLASRDPPPTNNPAAPAVGLAGIVGLALGGAVLLCFAIAATIAWLRRCWSAAAARDRRPVPVGNVRPLHAPRDGAAVYRPASSLDHDVDLPRYEPKSTPEYTATEVKTEAEVEMRELKPAAGQAEDSRYRGQAG